MYPNPSSGMVHGSEHLRLFEFLGRILGKALYEGITVRVGWLTVLYARRPVAEESMWTPAPLTAKIPTLLYLLPLQTKHTTCCLGVLCFVAIFCDCCGGKDLSYRFTLFKLVLEPQVVA